MAKVSKEKYIEILERIGDLDKEQTIGVMFALNSYGNDEVIDKLKECKMLADALNEEEIVELLKHFQGQLEEDHWDVLLQASGVHL